MQINDYKAIQPAKITAARSIIYKTSTPSNLLQYFQNANEKQTHMSTVGLTLLSLLEFTLDIQVQWFGV